MRCVIRHSIPPARPSGPGRELHGLHTIRDLALEALWRHVQAGIVKKRKQSATALMHVAKIERAVLRLRGYNVMLDSDLAALYQVDVKVLNQAVKRNDERFPSDFMFRLNRQEATFLRSQIVTSNAGRGGRRTLPYAFTEQGVAMLSSVLRSHRAVRVNIEIMRTFVRLRQVFESHAGLAKKLDDLEAKYDDQFTVVFRAIRGLMAPAAEPRRRIGYLRSST
jgi:hypothetical protein